MVIAGFFNIYQANYYLVVDKSTTNAAENVAIGAYIAGTIVVILIITVILVGVLYMKR